MKDILASTFSIYRRSTILIGNFSVPKKRKIAARMESNERYPGVCIPYLSSIDHSCWKFRTLEERKKTRHGREVMKDILASTFSIYRPTHSYWIFRTKEEKEIKRRRSGANGIYPGLGISRYSCGLRIISQVSNQAVDIMTLLLTIKRRRILMNRNAAEMKSDRI